MSALARGFIRRGGNDRSDSRKQKKAEEGPTLDIVSFLAVDDKSIASIERRVRVLFGGRSADTTGCTTGTHRTSPERQS